MTRAEIALALDNAQTYGCEHDPDCPANKGARALAAIVRELLAEREWRPMETAPRDGTAIYVVENSPRRWCHAVSWTDDGYGYHHGWYLDFEHEKHIVGGDACFSAWLPLPAPPEAR